MSITSGFFNSINGDRKYNADDINEYYKGILDDGVVKHYDADLKVEAGSDMTVNVMGGKAICLGKYVKNTGALELAIEAGESQPRYDAIIVGVDLETRSANIYVKKGTAAADPSYPAIINTDLNKELCLAYVYVAANATSISDTDIIDSRSDELICGWVKFSNISANLNVLRNNVTITTAGTSNIVIGIPEYNASTDQLFVYLNGLLMVETDEYTVNGTGSAASINLVNAIQETNSNVFTFVVFKMEI